jgi:hypothetical protein
MTDFDQTQHGASPLCFDDSFMFWFSLHHSKGKESKLMLAYGQSSEYFDRLRKKLGRCTALKLLEYHRMYV